MSPDATACAFGLFQVAFAEMVETLALAVYELKRQRDNSLTIVRLPNLFKPKRLLEDLKDELKQFDEYDSQGQYVEEVRRACGAAKEVLNWRNPRIHCRIRRTDTGVSLQSWDGKPLSLTAADCWSYINRAHLASSTLQAYVSQLVGSLEFYRAADELYAQILAQESEMLADELAPEDVLEPEEIHAYILAEELGPEYGVESEILAENVDEFNPEPPR
jgi:hypothetical protein